ncbi:MULTISPECIES: class A beta-lactamase [Streptomyces]|uniref:class A beta-lactamase n=1 Tax=Streptomyces TaxID=1883 RepID=UPI001EFF3800|nr:MULTISPECIES: class A beta-lactamase [Streptomyces]
MNALKSRPTRRALLVAGAGTALTAGLTGGTAAAAAPAASRNGHEVTRRLRALEREHSARLGVYARNLATGATVLHRTDERFPVCSLFKTLAAAAVLRDLDRSGEFLAKVVHYTEDELDKTWSPVTGLPENLEHGMTVDELCHAAITRSDNSAGNFLLRELGGPGAITRFCRSIGDDRTRLDRWEPELNSAEPWQWKDTTSPGAIGRTYARLVVGDVLEPHDRERLTGWLLANTTSGEQFRKGLPADWTVADKTGAGGYGTTNNAGVAWTPDGAPVALAVLTTKFHQDAGNDRALVAGTAELLAGALG